VVFHRLCPHVQAAKEAFQHSHQFPKVHWLHQVGIGPLAHSAHPLAQTAPSREDDNAQRGLLRAQTLCYDQTVFVGEAQVEQNEIARVSCEGAVDVMPVALKCNFKPFPAQEEG
jgi:hypothetical protein